MPDSFPPTGQRNYWTVLALCAAFALVAGVFWRPGVDEALQQSLPGQAPGRGFTSSVTCQACHPGQYDAWYESYHRTMTQPALPSTVLGRFDGVVLEDRGYQWRLERRGDEFWVEMPDPLWFVEPPWFMQILYENWPEVPPRIEARVVMTTGSHHMQNYWIRRPDSGDEVLGSDNGSLVQVPWIWLIPEARWIPVQDSFLIPPNDGIEPPAEWNAACSQCHSVATEPRVSEDGVTFDTRTQELGIACEACHGPAEEHVLFYRSPVRRYLRYLSRLQDPDSPDPTIVNPAKLDQARSLDTCAQCHSFGEWRDRDGIRQSGVQFRPGEDLDRHMAVFGYSENPDDPLLQEALDGDPFFLEGSFWRDGTIRQAGREYNGFRESTHFTSGEMTCLSCHSMHEYEAPDAQLHPGANLDSSCLTCHTEYEDQISDHTRHLPGSSGSECMNCHMPRTTYGLFSALRSHRVDNPSARVSVESGRPNACNLCHLDETLEWTSRHLNDWFGEPLVEMSEDERSVSAAALWVLRGDAAQRTIVGWHMGWEPAREEAGRSWMPPYLAQLLVDPYSAARQVAYRSILTLPGFQDFEYDYIAPLAEREDKARELLGLWLLSDRPAGVWPELLIGEDGQLDLNEWLRLLGERDLRPLEIVE